MQGLTKSNDFINRDEGLHCDFAVLLYTKYVVNKLSDSQMHALVGEAVVIEESFITESIPCSLLGMNSDMMINYIHHVANRLLTQLGYSKLYKDATQPFSFMDRICFDSKDNFFEGRVTSYQMTVEKTDEDQMDTLNFDADF